MFWKWFYTAVELMPRHEQVRSGLFNVRPEASLLYTIDDIKIKTQRINENNNKNTLSRKIRKAASSWSHSGDAWCIKNDKNHKLHDTTSKSKSF